MILFLATAFADCALGTDDVACDAIAYATTLHPEIVESSPAARLRPTTIYANLVEIDLIGDANGCGEAIAWSGTFGAGLFEGTNLVPEALDGSYGAGVFTDGSDLGTDYSAYDNQGRFAANYGTGNFPGRWIRTTGRRGLWIALEKSCTPEGSNPYESWVQ